MSRERPALGGRRGRRWSIVTSDPAPARPTRSRHVLIGVATMFAAALVVARRGIAFDLVLELPLVAVLAIVAEADLRRRVIPNRVLLPATVWGLAATPLVRFADSLEALAAGLGAFALFLLAALANSGGMGMGDVKLAGVLGLYLGADVIIAAVAAFAIALIASVAVVLRPGGQGRKTQLPFAPFLAIGGLTALAIGPEALAAFWATSG